MTSIAVNSTRLEYLDHGSGQAVVFVHGGLSDLRVWEFQEEAFADRYRTVVYSFRHYHPNPPVPAGSNITHEMLVDDLATLLRQLDIAPAHLVGQSTGGFVSLLLARDQPDLVQSLTLAEPPILPLLGLDVPPKPTQILSLLLRDPSTAVDVIKFGARGLGPTTRAFERGDDEAGLRAFLTAVIGKETVATWTEEQLQRARDNVHAFKAVLAAGMPPFGDQDARSIDIPTLLITGEKSAPVLHRITDKLEKLIPETERVDIDHASHLMFRDNPDAFNAAVLRFLERYSS